MGLIVLFLEFYLIKIQYINTNEEMFAFRHHVVRIVLGEYKLTQTPSQGQVIDPSRMLMVIAHFILCHTSKAP